MHMQADKIKCFGIKTLHKWPKKGPLSKKKKKKIGSYPRKHTMSEVILFTLCICQFAADRRKNKVNTLCQKVFVLIMVSCHKILQPCHCFYPLHHCSCFWKLLMRSFWVSLFHTSVQLYDTLCGDDAKINLFTSQHAVEYVSRIQIAPN